MQLNGSLLIGGRDVAGSGAATHGIDPATGRQLPVSFATAGARDVDQACELAAQAFDAYRLTTPEQRAQLLERIAQGIEALGDVLVERTMAETGLPRGRIEGERGRTAGQLRLFAGVLRAGQWQQATFDTPLPQRQPARRPDLRMQQVALGPVAVFAASNFPLAFSVAGGDTASALAAGCPVIVKAHPAHPGTSELVGRVVQDAVRECGLPVGVFALLRGPGREVGEQLVHHPAIQAVGFTGSRAGGLALCRIAQSRPQPIPVYAEMSAINPVFLLPAALAARTSTIARGFVDSLVLGAGQFCTNPGVVLGIDGPDWRAFVAEVARALGDKPAATMLSSGIHAAYEQGTRHLAALPVERVGQGQAGTGGCAAQAVVHETSAAQWLATPALAEEVFGPSSVLVRCADAQELRRVAEALEGQLTATLHLEDTDLPLARGLLPVLERKAGRILANGFPTGVEVSHAMVHGGPFPATSDGRTTSVGAAALGRFLRPVCYQDLPEALLPPALQSGNPLGVWRSVDGTPTAP
jgi:NADP-dependent aldehyde dehydrogenase